MIDELLKRVQTALTDAQSPAVLFSGGKDSLLLTALVRRLRTDFCVVWFRGGPDNFTRQTIRDWGLTAVSWAPRDVYLLAQAGERVLVNEYDFGGTSFPVITDLSPGTQCSRVLPPLTPQCYPGFDVLLWGAKDCDTHWLKDSASFPPDGHSLGNAKLFAPLRHLTDDQILAAIEDLGLPYQPQPDSQPMCSACMESTGEVHCPQLNTVIPAVQADWAAGVTAFRNRFNLEA